MQNVVEGFLRGQVGAGKDESPPNEQDVYHIRIEVDLSFDIFTSRHDCGNLGLRDGILLHFAKTLDENDVVH